MSRGHGPCETNGRGKPIRLVTDEERDAICFMFVGSLKTDEIARLMKRSLSTVHSVLKKRGLMKGYKLKKRKEVINFRLRNL